MVDIKQGALRALEQDALAGAAGAVQQHPHVIDEGQDARRNLGQFALQGIPLYLGFAEPAPQRVVVHQQPINLGAQRAEVLQILRADGPAADLVLVGRPYAASGRADLALARRALAQLIELAMQRQDQRGVLCDP